MLACISIPVSKSCLLYFCRLFEWLMIPANLSGLTFDANLTKMFVLKISITADKQQSIVSIAKPLKWEMEVLCQHSKTTKLETGGTLSA